MLSRLAAAAAAEYLKRIRQRLGRITAEQSTGACIVATTVDVVTLRMA
jgi:hypothetical protein